MKKNILIGQFGGPTVAINASLAGAVMGSLKNTEIGEIYGARNGVKGLLNRNLIDLKHSIKSEEDLQLLKETPAMALGSCRYKMPDQPSEIYPKILKTLKSWEFRKLLTMIYLNVLQRSASHISSATDIAEASKVGEVAVQYAVSGRTGVVAVINRISN